MNELHGILFAFRSNPQLRELIEHRTTSSLPFGGRYRGIDFMLSNMVNAGVIDIGVIMREGYQSLLNHLGSGKTWDLSRKHGGLQLLPPFAFAKRLGKGAFRGRMEALAGVYSYLEDIRQEYVVLANADVIVNLPLREILNAHIQTGADITAVCTDQKKGDPASCTYFITDQEREICDVICRPTSPVGYESLEIFILSKALLLQLVDYCAIHNLYDFDEAVLQGMHTRLKLTPYFFQGYAARLHSVANYFERSMDLLNPQVRQSLFVPERPIFTKDISNPGAYYSPCSHVASSLVADGCIIEGRVENAILFPGVKVDRGAQIQNSILMQSAQVGADAVLNYVITDKYVTVCAGRVLMGHAAYPLAIARDSEV